MASKRIAQINAERHSVVGRFLCVEAALFINFAVGVMVWKYDFQIQKTMMHTNVHRFLAIYCSKWDKC